MLKLKDGFKLALTKLKLRKLRTFITVFAASLVFGGMFFLLSITSATPANIQKFSSKTFTQPYRALATFNNNTLQDKINQIQQSPLAIDKARSIEQAELKRRSDLAKKLGIEYDPKQEPSAITKYDDGREILTPFAPATKQALQELTQHLNDTDQQFTNTLRQQYQAHNIYRWTTRNALPSPHAYNVIIKGQEITPDSAQQVNLNNRDQQKPPEFARFWHFIDKAAIEPLLLPNLHQLKLDESTIPIVAPFHFIEQQLGFKPLPASTPLPKKLQRLSEVRDRAHTVQFQICYRNSISSEQIKQAEALTKTQSTLKTKDKPKLVYDFKNDGSCTPARLLEDNRTAEEKQLAAKHDQFQQALGQPTAPEQRLIKFQIVGIASDYRPIDNLPGATIDYFRSQVFDDTWLIPNRLDDQVDYQARANKLLPSLEPDDHQLAQAIVDFKDQTAFNNFIDQTYCDQDIENACQTRSWRGNYLDLDLKRVAHYTRESVRIFFWAIVVISVGATIILISMIGKIIADNQRETAIFRALGAKRSDIVMIYFIYTFILLVMVTICALIVGFGGVLIMDANYANDLTIVMRLLYLFGNDQTRFSFINIWPLPMLTVLLTIFISGLAGVSSPLSRNLKRNPIQDMKDEN